MTAEAVKVIVRCRPMNGREKDLKCKVTSFFFAILPRGTLTFVDGKFPVPQRDPSGKNVERKTQKRVELRN